MCRKGGRKNNNVQPTKTPSTENKKNVGKGGNDSGKQAAGVDTTGTGTTKKQWRTKRQSNKGRSEDFGLNETQTQPLAEDTTHAKKTNDVGPSGVKDKADVSQGASCGETCAAGYTYPHRFE